jgi:hypothetical protein
MDAAGTGALVEIVDILRAEIKAISQLLFDFRNGDMPGIRLRSEGIAAAHGVEAPDEFGIRAPGFRRCYVLDSIAVPEPTGASKGS